MTTKKQKKQMLDYLVDRLINCGEEIVPKTKQIMPDILSNYILVGDDGIVLLVDKIHSNNALNELYRRARKQRENVGLVLYKDGKNFFRSAAEKNYYKMRKDLSLKDYSDEDLHKMILFRPEENLVYDKKGQKLQYYQPGSERLPEGLITYEFEPVYYDYSHIDSRDRFRPRDTDSKKLRIWKDKKFCDGKLRLETKIPDKGILKERK